VEQWDGVERRSKTFWNGSATKILMLLFAILAFLGTYLFGEIVDLPKTYACKKDVSELRNAMDKGFQEMRNGISDINRFLRDNKP